MEMKSTNEVKELVALGEIALDIHKEGVNAHNPKRYYYGVDRSTKQVVFTCDYEWEARELAIQQGYDPRTICWNF